MRCPTTMKQRDGDAGYAGDSRQQVLTGYGAHPSFCLFAVGLYVSQGCNLHFQGCNARKKSKKLPFRKRL